MGREFFSFAAISGAGWLIDIGLSFVLVASGLWPFWASAIGAATAVTFVYLVSRLFLFSRPQIGTKLEYAIYVFWQIFAITVASLLVAGCATVLAAYLEAAHDPVAAATVVGKVIVIPLTLVANYLFLRWLAFASIRWRSEKRRP